MNSAQLLPKPKIRKCHYTFQSSIQQVRISVRFPCRISVTWNYGQGEVHTPISKPLNSGIAKFDDQLTFTTVIFYDEEKQKFADLKSTMEVSIVTDNGTSLAGFVTLDLGGILNRKDRRELFEIERCPDKSAAMRMRLTFRATDDKPRNRVRLLNANNYQDSDIEDQAMVMRPTPVVRSVTPRSQYALHALKKPSRSPQKPHHHPQHLSRNKDMLDKQLMVLKARLSEFENKYKNQRAEKERLTEMIKSKDDVFFSVKTEVKRKEIQLGDVYRSLEEYRGEYERVKLLEENGRKDSQRLQRLLEHTERTSFEKINKLELELTASQKKSQKSLHQIDKTKKQRDTILSQQKLKHQQWSRQKQLLNEQIRVLRRQKEDLSRVNRLEKENQERALREFSKKVKELEEELEAVRSAMQGAEKRAGKIEEARVEEVAKLKGQLVEAERQREVVGGQLEALKYSSARKQQSLLETIKNHELKISDDKSMINSLKTLTLQIQSQLSSIQTQNTTLKRQLLLTDQKRNIGQQLKSKLQLQLSVYRNQIASISQQLTTKTTQLKSLTTKHRQYQQTTQTKLTKMKQTHQQAMLTINQKMSELRFAEQTKLETSSKMLVRKEKELDEAMNREHRLNSLLENMRQEMKRADGQNREKVEEVRRVEAGLRQTLQANAKELENKERQASNKLTAHLNTIKKLQSTTLQLQQSLATSTEQQYRLRQQNNRLLQQLDQSHQLKLLLDQQQQRLRQCQWCIEQLNEQIRLKSLSELTKQSQLRQLKERLFELEGEKAKKEHLVKEKEKALANANRQLVLEIEERARVVTEKEGEMRGVQEELREVVRRERERIDDLVIDGERLNNQLTLTKADSQKYCLALQQCQSQLKSLRQSSRLATEQTQSLTSSLQHLHSLTSELQQSKFTLESVISDKDKQLRRQKQLYGELLQHSEEQARSLVRNGQITGEILEIALRLDCGEKEKAMVLASTSGLEKEEKEDQFDRLARVKKVMMSAEYKMRRLVEVTNQRDGQAERQRTQQSAQNQRLNSELTKTKTQLIKLRKQFQQLTFSNNFLKIQSEQLSYRTQQLQNELSESKKNISQFEIKLKGYVHEKQLLEQEIKVNNQRYEGLLEETRLTISEKAEKQRKEMAANVRRLEQKVEEQQESLFAYELEAQRLPEISKREEENRRLATKIAEVQKEYIIKLQDQTKKCEELEAQVQRTNWEKRLVQDTLQSTQSKHQKSLSALNANLDQSQTKNKSLSQQIRLLQQQKKKLQQSLQKCTIQLTSLKSSSQQQQDRWSSSELKLKNQLNRQKVQLSQHKRTIQQLTQKLSILPQLKLAKSTLQQELSNRDSQVTIFQQKQQRLSEQILNLRQQFDQLKWDYQKKLQFKQNQIMSMQQQLFKVNSKQNLRYLKDSENLQKVRTIQTEKKTLTKQNHQLKVKLEQLQQQLVMFQNQNQLLHEKEQENHVSSWEAMSKQEEIMMKLQEGIDSLTAENGRLRELLRGVNHNGDLTA